MRNSLTGFTAKIFIFATAFVIVISAAFTGFFITSQHASLEEGLIHEGSAYVRLLANSARLAVISENSRFVEDTIGGLLKHEEIAAVSIFTGQGKILVKKRRSDRKIDDPKESSVPPGLFDRLKETKQPINIKREKFFYFWAPVLSNTASSDAALFFDEEPLRRDQVIGYAGIVFDASLLNMKLEAVLIRALMTGLFFLLAGSLVAFLAARKVARPLNRLTMAVKSVEARGFAEDVPVETSDEIGRLAHSFNEMIAAVKKRESENLHLEAQLRQSQKMEAIGQLAGGVAHEINNPVNSIANFAQLIIDEDGKEKSAQQYAERIMSDCSRISNIVKGLLAFSRISVDQKRPVNIKAVLSDTLDLVAPQLKKEGTTLTVDVSKDLPEVTCNGYQIVQVFLNVISNARYALNKRYPDKHENKVLRILCDEAEIEGARYVRTVFRDHGTGIPAGLVEKVANPFFTTKPQGSGTGLGLSISYGIIHEHGGRLIITSTEGEYTSAEVCLPAGGKHEGENTAC
jgi:signal transduction histidine kinase